MLTFQYKNKSINIANRFGIGADDPEDDDDDVGVNIAINLHRKRRRTIRKKSKNIGGIK